MSISGLSSSPLPAWLQQLETSVVSSLGTSTPFSTDSAGAAQSSSASSTTSTSAANAPSTPSTQFAPDLLSALLSTQSAPPSADSVASGLISQLDSNSDGSLSLAEVTQAMTGQGNSTGTASTQATDSGAVSTQATASNAVASAFAKLDTNGDGQLSSSELAAAITSLNQEASSVSGHHRHHHQADATQQASQSTPTSESTAASTSASSTTTASASGAASS